MIQRDPQHYGAGYKGDDPRKAPFYLRALFFDGKCGDFNTSLVDGFNRLMEEKEMFSDCRLVTDRFGDRPPRKIVVVNASHDDLPTSYETARVFEDLCVEKGWTTKAKVVNTRDELLAEINEDPQNTLLMSQCVDKKVYNVELADELTRKGVVAVPGRTTAPGSVFSDKDSTYQLLSENGRNWDKVARYKKISARGKKTEKVVDGILTAVEELRREICKSTFFVKPHEGGGGLGGFRVTRTDKGYIIPDLSKVSGDTSVIHPTFVDLDLDNEARLHELLWIYRLFAADEKMTENYLLVKLPVVDTDDETAIRILRDYLQNSAQKRKKRLKEMEMSPADAREKLIAAIDIFEEKFDRKYIPLVNEHIDFGLWGLRAHYRLSRKGPRLETIYHRVFQLGFTEEGIGYLGSDNISNKQTHELEIHRLGPINKIMVEAIGGEEALYHTLSKGAEALVELAGLIPEEERDRVPLRLQLDLATISGRIGEGNADTARGLCLASRWTEFVHNAREWFEDSLVYYAWRKEK